MNRKAARENEEFMDLMAKWQEIETGIIEYTKKEMPRTESSLIRTMLKVMQLEAQKYGAVQQMVVESVARDPVNLSPEDLKALSGHFDKRLGKEEKVLSLINTAIENNETLMPRYLLAYLSADIKKHSELLRKFGDRLKTASIPTSVTSKSFEVL